MKSGLAPDEFVNRPSVPDDLAALWHAYLDLSASRAIGMDVSPIATNDVLAWFDIHDVPRSARADWYELIRTLDCKAREWIEENKPRPRK